MKNNQSIYRFSAKTIDGKEISLDHYRGKTLLIVNVASQCGFTKQYEGLERLYQKYSNQGFVVLGFPCNQFAHQEPGNEQEIKNFCTTQYQISFPLFAKIHVNGKNVLPLFKFLKQQKKGFLGIKFIKWNFTKFLVNSEGKVLKRYSPIITPEKIEHDLKFLFFA